MNSRSRCRGEAFVINRSICGTARLVHDSEKKQTNWELFFVFHFGGQWQQTSPKLPLHTTGSAYNQSVEWSCCDWPCAWQDTRLWMARTVSVLQTTLWNWFNPTSKCKVSSFAQWIIGLMDQDTGVRLRKSTLTINTVKYSKLGNLYLMVFILYHSRVPLYYYLQRHFMALHTIIGWKSQFEGCNLRV